MKHAWSKAILIAVTTLVPCIFMASPAMGAPIYLVDQYSPGPASGTSGALGPHSFGQSFIPALSKVDAFEFLLGGFSANVVVRLRDGVSGFDGLNGNIIAESLPVLVDQQGDILFHFDFPATVMLTPGKTYVAELFADTGLLGVRFSPTIYGNGRFLSQGFATGALDYDLTFWEGVHATPEPSSWIMLGIGLVALWGSRASRRGTQRYRRLPAQSTCTSNV